MPEFTLTLDDDLIVVDCLFKGPKNILPAAMGMDSGSALSSLPPELMTALGFDLSKPDTVIPVLTASKIEAMPVFLITKMFIWGIALRDVEIACWDLPEGESRVDGLIGMNIIKRFHLCIDVNSRILEIR